MIYRLEFACDGVQGRIELEIPAAGPARYDAVFSGAAVGAGLVVVRDSEVPRPRGPMLELRADGLWVEFVCETPDEHWSFGLEAFGLRVDDPSEDIGERLAVGYDLEWETPNRVHGDLLLARTTLPITALGSFTVLPTSPTTT